MEVKVIPTIEPGPKGRGPPWWVILMLITIFGALKATPPGLFKFLFP